MVSAEVLDEVGVVDAGEDLELLFQPLETALADLVLLDGLDGVLALGEAVRVGAVDGAEVAAAQDLLEDEERVHVQPAELVEVAEAVVGGAARGETSSHLEVTSAGAEDAVSGSGWVGAVAELRAFSSHCL